MDSSKIYSNIENAIFIIGCGRSGTTFLGSLIGAHSQCIVTPESQFKINCYTGNVKNNFNAKKSFEEIQNTERFKIWETDINFSDSELHKITKYPNLILEIVKKYNELKQQKQTAKIWVDHTPVNIESVDTLKTFYPNAKFLHIIRDGRAVAASFKNVTWGPKSMYAIADHWIKKLAYGFAYKIKYPDDVLEIKYEDLILDTEETVRKISNFIGIEYEEEMLSANGLIVPSYTKHQHQLVGQKADRSRINSWQNNLSKREIELFEYKTKNMLTLLNYNTIFSQPRRERKKEYIFFLIHQKYKKYISKLINLK